VKDEVAVCDIVDFFSALEVAKNKALSVAIIKNVDWLTAMLSKDDRGPQVCEKCIDSSTSSLKNIFCFPGAASHNVRPDLAAIEACGIFLKKIFC
jgi:hypothetical protein